LGQLLRQHVAEPTEIHRHLAELAAVTEPRPTHTNADVPQACSSSDDARRLLRRLDVAVNVMRQELDRLDDRKHNDLHALVHGGFVDGSGWQGVYDELKKAGHFEILQATSSTSVYHEWVALLSRRTPMGARSQQTGGWARLAVLSPAGGSLTAKVAPLPGSEITRSVPPIRSTSSREM
jgi:hypothetical protein